MMFTTIYTKMIYDHLLLNKRYVAAKSAVCNIYCTTTSDHMNNHDYQILTIEELIPIEVYTAQCIHCIHYTFS